MECSWFSIMLTAVCELLNVKIQLPVSGYLFSFWYENFGLLVALISFVILGNNVIFLVDFSQNIFLFCDCFHVRISCDIIVVIFMLTFDHLSVEYLLTVVFNGKGIFGFN